MKTAVRRIVSVGILLILLFAMQRLVMPKYVSAQIKSAVKVNTEQLFFNWQLGRDLVERKAEEKWGKGIVEQLSLDLQNEFPKAKGF